MGFRGLVAMQFNKERKGTVKEELLACWFHYVDPEELIRSVREKTQDVAIQYLTKPWSKRDCIRAFETDQYGVPCFEAKDVSEDDISQFCMDISVCIRVDCRMEDYCQLKLREDGQPDMDICALSLPELTEALRSIVPDRAVNYAQQTEIALRKMGLHLRTA